MIRPLVPSFLKKLDQQLLLNKPDTWSARVHLVVYYSLLFCLVIGLYCLVSFNDPRQKSQSEVPMIFTLLISICGLVAWLFFLLRFNVFKRFGNDAKWNGLKTFLLFFTGFFFIVLPNYVPMLVESIKANAKYSSKEIARDANRINVLLAIKHGNSVPQKLSFEAYKKVDAYDNRVKKDAALQVATDTVLNKDSIYYNLVDLEEWNQKLTLSDSVLLLTDSTLLLYQIPDMVLVSAYEAAQHCLAEKVYNSSELYNAVQNKKLGSFTPAMASELQQLLDKYTIHSVSDYYYDDGNNSYAATMLRQYGLQRINNSIYQISYKKYTWDADKLPVYGRIIFYISFCLSVLLFVFRHSTRRSFFLSLLAIVLLMIVDGLLLSILGSTELGIFGMILLNYLLVLIVWLMNKKASTQQLVAGIALHLVTLFLAFVPLLCTCYYYELFAFDASGNYISYSNRATHLLIAEAGGIVLFLILAEPFIKKAYRYWYALPEN